MPSRDEIQYDMTFYHGAYPLWKFLEKSFDVDIRTVCTRVTKEEPMLKCDSGELTARVFTDPKNVRLVSPATNPECRADVTFLLNCVNIVYNTLKVLAKRNGELFLKSYSFQLTEDCCLELVDEETGERVCDSVIGVVSP